MRIEVEVEGELEEVLRQRLKADEVADEVAVEDVVRGMLDGYCSLSPLTRHLVLRIAEHPDVRDRSLVWAWASRSIEERAIELGVWAWPKDDEL